jgi:hypothetical protein
MELRGGHASMPDRLPPIPAGGVRIGRSSLEGMDAGDDGAGSGVSSTTCITNGKPRNRPVLIRLRSRIASFCVSSGITTPGSSLPRLLSILQA